MFGHLYNFVTQYTSVSQTVEQAGQELDVSVVMEVLVIKLVDSWAGLELGGIGCRTAPPRSHRAGTRGLNPPRA